MKDPFDYFHTRYTFEKDRLPVWREFCRYLQERYIPRESRLLDLGAGYCYFINNIAAREKHALDLFEGLAEHASRGVVTHVQSCTSVDTLGPGRFDVVFTSNLFEHLSRPELLETLAKVRTVLRPGGKLIIFQPNFTYSYKKYFDDVTHLQIFTHVGLSDLLTASGFRVLQVKPRFLPFTMKSKLPRYPWLVRLYMHSPVKPLAGQMLLVAERLP